MKVVTLSGYVQVRTRVLDKNNFHSPASYAKPLTKTSKLRAVVTEPSQYMFNHHKQISRMNCC